MNRVSAVGQQLDTLCIQRWSLLSVHTSLGGKSYITVRKLLPFRLLSSLTEPKWSKKTETQLVS